MPKKKTQKSKPRPDIRGFYSEQAIDAIATDLANFICRNIDGKPVDSRMVSRGYVYDSISAFLGQPAGGEM